jgi:phosphohistidine phosphatase
MKRAIFIRHAKSDWSNPSWTDFERPLNERGLRNAPMMGHWLKEQGILPDIILCSPALRTLTTAQLIAKEVGFDTENILPIPAFYEGRPNDLLKVVERLSDTYNTAFVIAHNPATTELLQLFDGNWSVPNVPTCGMFGVEIADTSWQAMQPNLAKRTFFVYPKMMDAK